MNIFEINQQIKEAYEASVDSDTGEIKDGGLSVITNLEMLKTEKVKSIGYLYKQSEYNTNLIDQEMDRLKTLKTREKNKRESIKNLLDAVMKSEGLTELGVGTLKVGYRKTPPRVLIDNEGALPANFKKIYHEVKIDKNELKKALKEGPIEGAHLESDLKLYIK